MMGERVGWGVLGCGNIARHAVAPAIRWSCNGRLVGVASRSLDAARRFASELQAARAFGSYQALLEDPEIQAIYVGLPNGLHAEWCLRAAEANKHVLCEKSLTLDLASARRIAEAFDRRGLRLVEAFMYRHHPQWGVVRAALAEIGSPTLVRATLCGRLERVDDHRWLPSLGGGALFDVTCYGVDVARWLVGREPLRVCATATMAASGVDATSGATLDFGGALASIAGSLTSAHDQSVVVLGSEGRIEVTKPFVPEWAPTEIVVTRGGERRVISVPGANHFLHQVEHFASLLLDAPKSPDPAENGVRNIAACEAIARSIREGRAIDVAR